MKVRGVKYRVLNTNDKSIFPKIYIWRETEGMASVYCYKSLKTGDVLKGEINGVIVAVVDKRRPLFSIHGVRGSYYQEIKYITL